MENEKWKICKKIGKFGEMENLFYFKKYININIKC